MKSIFILLTIFFCGCAMNKNNSSIEINDDKFQISPTIIYKEGKYFLKYQFKMTDTLNIENKLVLNSMINCGEGYFYLVGPISYRQQYNIVEIEIKGEYLTLMRLKSLYWLNPDGSKIELKYEK